MALFYRLSIPNFPRICKRLHRRPDYDIIKLERDRMRMVREVEQMLTVFLSLVYFAGMFKGIDLLFRGVHSFFTDVLILFLLAAAAVISLLLGKWTAAKVRRSRLEGWQGGLLTGVFALAYFVCLFQLADAGGNCLFGRIPNLMADTAAVVLVIAALIASVGLAEFTVNRIRGYKLAGS